MAQEGSQGLGGRGPGVRVAAQVEEFLRSLEAAFEFVRGGQGESGLAHTCHAPQYDDSYAVPFPLQPVHFCADRGQFLAPAGEDRAAGRAWQIVVREEGLGAGALSVRVLAVSRFLGRF